MKEEAIDPIEDAKRCVIYNRARVDEWEKKMEQHLLYRRYDAHMLPPTEEFKRLEEEIDDAKILLKVSLRDLMSARERVRDK